MIVTMIKDVCLCVWLCVHVCVFVENVNKNQSFKSLEEMCYNIELLMYHLLNIIFKSHFKSKRALHMTRFMAIPIRLPTVSNHLSGQQDGPMMKTLAENLVTSINL